MNIGNKTVQLSLKFHPLWVTLYRVCFQEKFQLQGYSLRTRLTLSSTLKNETKVSMSYFNLYINKTFNV